MKTRKRNAEQTKDAILKAAQRLFAERGIDAASIRDIAKAVGVSHGLVQQYFGTRERMIAAIIRNSIKEFEKLLPEGVQGKSEHPLESFRRMLRTGGPQFHDFAVLIMRAELAGVEPEKMIDPESQTPAMMLAATIRDLQAKSSESAGRMDPRLVSAYINATIFAFEAMSPWLMAAVGLKPEDYEQRYDEIVEISVKLVALSAGLHAE